MRSNRIRSLAPALVASVLAFAVAMPAAAGITVYEKDEKYVEIGGRIQFQYYLNDPDSGDSSDRFFFRRLRPYIEGTVTENWHGKFQFDIGNASSDNEVAVKDAYLRYTGFDKVTITIGNQKPPFSREFLTSSKRQQLVERTFPGDHNFGSPDRMLGVQFAGKSASKKVTWAASIGDAAIDPDVKKLDFDTPVNRQGDWNQGLLLAGRVDFHPLGELKMAQGDFDRDRKFTIGVAAYTWANDDDNNTFTSGGFTTSSSKADVDDATGIELSFGLRGGGLSLDAQYQLIDSDLVDGTFTGGLFRGGQTELDELAVEAGYMVAPSKFELVAGYESLDADNYADAWTRTSVGMNYFWNKHKVKWQLTYRMGENVDGIRGNDRDEGYVQMQFVF